MDNLLISASLGQARLHQPHDRHGSPIKHLP